MAALALVKSRTVEMLRGGEGEGIRRTAALAVNDQACAEILAREAEKVVWMGEEDIDIDFRLAAYTWDLLHLATGYRSRGGRYEGDPDLRGEIISRIHHVLETFDPAIPRMRSSGFHRWRIQVPQALSSTALLMEEELGVALLTRIRSHLAFQLSSMDLTGANAAWDARNNIYLALLDGDPARLGRASEYLFNSVLYSATDGVREDYGYVFHGRIPYAGGYGAGFAETTSQFIYLLEGTPWAPPRAKQDLVINLLLEHTQWFIKNGRMDIHIRGRGYRSKQMESIKSVAESLLYLAQVDTERQDEIALAAARILQADLPISLSLANRADEAALRPVVPLEGFRYWSSAEMAAFRGQGFHVGLRQYSRRVQDYEYLTQSGGDGWNLAYGFTNILRSDRAGDWFEENLELSDAADFEYLPGTTTRLGAHPENPLLPFVSNSGFSLNYGTSPFAGGAGLEKGGVAGFLLEPVHGDFTARKSVHFFPEGFWALGSGITSTADRAEHKPVHTAILQRSVPTGAKMIVNGQTHPFRSGQRDLPLVQWLWIDGTGIVFENTSPLKARLIKNMLTLWIDHGPHPDEAGYAYAVLPNTSLEQVEAFGRDLPVRPVKRDSTAHVVRDSMARSEGFVFFQAGTASGFETDQPLVLFRQSSPRGSRYSVQDPLHETSALRFTVPEGGIPHSPYEEVRRVETGRSRSLMEIENTLGREYRFGLGPYGSGMRPRAREDLASMHAFRVETRSDARYTWITAHMTESEIEADHTVTVHAHKGQLLLELTEDHVVDRSRPGVIEYKWDRSTTRGPGGSRLNQAGVASDYRIYLAVPMKTTSDYFTVPAFDENGAQVEPVEYLRDRDNPYPN